MNKWDSRWAMRRTCDDCPFLLSSPVGKFSAERFLDLAHTCKPGEMPGNVFACHNSPAGREKACAGMILVTRDDLPNRLRLMVSQGLLNPDDISATGPLFASYRDMATANGCDPDAPELIGLPESQGQEAAGKPHTSKNGN
jgi:hypothetical protein